MEETPIQPKCVYNDDDEAWTEEMKDQGRSIYLGTRVALSSKVISRVQ